MVHLVKVKGHYRKVNGKKVWVKAHTKAQKRDYHVRYFDNKADAIRFKATIPNRDYGTMGQNPMDESWGVAYWRRK